MPTAETPRVRAAEESDLAQVQEIQRHYVEHTVILFDYEPPPVEAKIAQLRDHASRDWPYLVATGTATDGDEASLTGAPPAAAERVIGFTYLSPFRRFKEGYKHTVELSIFVRPKSTRRGGAGPALMGAMLTALRERNANLRARAGGGAKEVEVGPVAGEVKQVVLVMAVDDRAPERDAAVTRFYERYGFEERGMLRKVGWKFGRWIDTRYLQLEL